MKNKVINNTHSGVSPYNFKYKQKVQAIVDSVSINQNIVKLYLKILKIRRY